MRFKVSWGELSSIVEGADVTEAWAAFVDSRSTNHPELQRFPKLHERVIEPLDDVEVETT
jgi:hypothetical protein